MKMRIDFVTNSSSTAFIITNTTKKTKTLVDFVNENPQLIGQFIEEYENQNDEMCQCKLVASANSRAEAAKKSPKGKDTDTSGGILPPGENYCIFGDEEGDLIGRVFDYRLRHGGESKSFKWRFKEWLR